MGQSYVDLLTVGQWPAALAGYGLSLQQQQNIAERINSFATAKSCSVRQLEFFTMDARPVNNFWLAAPSGHTIRVSLYRQGMEPPMVDAEIHGYDPRRCRRAEHTCELEGDNDDNDECEGCEYDSDWCLEHENYH